MLLVSCILSLRLIDGRTILETKESAAAAEIGANDGQTVMELREDLGTQLREHLATRFDVKDPTFNQILEDVLKSIHRYSRPRYGRSVYLDRSRLEPQTNEIRFEKTLEVVAETATPVSS